MKGIVFTEFLELVEKKFGFDMADDIIDECELESEGSYTQVGVYDYKELLQLVTVLSEKTKLSVNDLVNAFGEHLIGQFVEKFPTYFKEVDNSFDFLDTVENKIHVEVKKLYPDAELPTFTTNSFEPNKMEITYQSERPFSALAYGMMMGCADYYSEKITISMDEQSTGEFTRVKFTLCKENN